MHNDVSRILFSEQDIANRVADLGAAITHDYAQAARDEGLILVCTLRGGAMFTQDLARRIELPLEMDYMAVSSYGNEAVSSGVVRIVKDLAGSIEGRHVLICEDIIDSGLTLSYLRKLLLARKPASLEIAALLWKDNTQRVKIDCKYVGFECPDEFIVGYGLDYAERYRNLPYIGVLKPEVYS